MCNIAGYAGNQNAAPILLEMLRQQQDYDGGLSTGIITIHEGQFHYRKVIGDVDTLMKTTDALYLPGTIGIAHTRPAGTAATYGFAHPFVSEDGTLAAVINGTGRGIKDIGPRTEEALEMLQDAGYTFGGGYYSKGGFHALRNGRRVSPVEVRLNLIEYYMKQGQTMEEAMARCQAELFTDKALVMLNRRTPDEIYALRTSRPLYSVIANGETYVATAPFAFPEGLNAQMNQLPLHHVCRIGRDGITVTATRMDCDPVPEMTPYTYKEGYRRIVEMLTGKKDAPLYFDDLELAVYRNMKDLWPKAHPTLQDARLVYDILYQLTREGRLQTKIQPLGGKPGAVNRAYMWIE